MGNQLQGTLAGRQPDQNPGGEFCCCRWKVKGGAAEACGALRKGSEDMAGDEGLATAFGMENVTQCIVLFCCYLYFYVSKEKLGDQAAAVLSQEA